MNTRTNTLLVAAFVASGAVMAQPERPTTDPQTQLIQQIAELRAAGGPAAAGLLERLHLLGLLYQESGDHALASVALDEARYVTRVNSGLFSVDEALLIRQQIRSEKALGLDERVWDLERDMELIARKHLDNMRTVPILRDLADHRVQVLRKMRTGALPPEIYLGCYFAGPQPRYDDARAERPPDAGDSCRFGTRDAITMRLRDEILMYYADAIAVILKNGDYASQELRDLERQALRLGFPASYPVLPDVGSAMTTDVSFVGVGARCPLASLDELLALELLGGCLDPVFHSEGRVIANVGSWVSLVRLIAYEIRAEASPADRANAFVELADWHLLSAPADRRHFEPSTQRALELYERALGQLQAGTAASEAAALMFSPELPVTLPITAANPFTRAAEASARYIDAAFSITKLGRGEQIEILPTSQGATRADERDVTRLIEGTSFRPRFVDGALADSARVVVRYALDP